jgi:hypothetical protein
MTAHKHQFSGSEQESSGTASRVLWEFVSINQHAELEALVFLVRDL